MFLPLLVGLWEIVEPQSSSFSKKRQAVCVKNQEDVNYEGTLVKSTAGIQKEEYAAHTTAELAVVD